MGRFLPRRKGSMLLRGGTCRWCRCTELNACPQGCGWADRDQTLCTACVDVDAAWSVKAKKAPNGRRAFFRGFMAGRGDDRATDWPSGNSKRPSNPYIVKTSAYRNWDDGFDVSQIASSIWR